MERIRDEGLLTELMSDRTAASSGFLDALMAGGKAEDVLEWQQVRNRMAAARSHYLERLRAEVERVDALDDIHSRARHVRQLLVQADSLSSLLRETFSNEPLDEDGAHVRVWRHAFNRFGERYGLFSQEAEPS